MGAGKGSIRRKCLVSQEEENIRWQLAYGKISREEFDRKLKVIKENKNDNG